ncbi:MAG: cation:proton antiporter [Candidatus Diapherotrites archaeon]|nr:cation:proton antiporter [Candidatus Diapherotrites archaeon]
MILLLNIFLFLGIVFIFTLLIGWLLERVKVPWVFAALIIGFIAAIKNPFSGEIAPIVASPTFAFLASLGMYFLLFVIGFEIDLHEMKRKSGLILKTTFVTILLGTLFGALLVYYIFIPDWIIAIIVALSFSTVGEAVLIPILDEFKLVNSDLGQTIIGIGVFDDLIEILTLILVIALIGSTANNHISTLLTIGSLLALFGMAALFSKFGKAGKEFHFLSIETLFLFTISVMFLFLGIGEYADSAPLAALLAGVSIRTFIPDERLKFIEKEIRTMCYGLFAPIFFFSVGAAISPAYLLTAPLLILLIVLVTGAAKMIGSYLATIKELGLKKSTLIGIGLSVRFSTSIVIIKILLEKGIINNELYSALIASTVVFTFVIPILFSYLIVRWRVTKARTTGGILPTK